MARITILAGALLFVGVCACSLKTLGELPSDGGSTCDAGQVLCGNFCVDVQTDRLNCGSCGTECGLMEQCIAGDCTCSTPFLLCGDECIDPRIDRRHCGRCGNACDPLATCIGGTCTCTTGFEECGGVCVNTSTDRNNCGGCGNVCTPEQVCSGTGVCTTNCASGFDLCDQGMNPYCADLTNDPLNCGWCHNVCGPYDHATPLCTDSSCNMFCDTGYADALNGLDDGCECMYMGVEICDAIDNDCDGSTDTPPFTCKSGLIQACQAYGSCWGEQKCDELACEWGVCGSLGWSCTNPGGTGTRDCNETCGTESRTCSADCVWGDWGTCTLKGESECWNGYPRDCGNCGTETCAGCRWGGCTGEGECARDTVDTTCNPTGTSCPGTRTCSVTCAWGTCTETCGGAAPDCCAGGCTNLSSDEDNCRTCGNACGGGTPHCCSGFCRQCCVEGDCGSTSTPHCCPDGTCKECCGNDAQCADGNTCTTDTCNGDGTCSHTNLPDMAICSGGRCCGGQCRSGASCCEDDDCPDCTGTATPCGTMTVAQCVGQNGCSVGGDTCTGTAGACSGYTTYSNCSDCGCNWNSGVCGGGPDACSDHSSSARCLLCGCTWNTAACSGTHAACSTYSEANCPGQLGCHVPTCPSYQCI